MDRYQLVLFFTLCLLIIKDFSPTSQPIFHKPTRTLSIAKKFQNKEVFKIFLASTTGIKIPLKSKTKMLFSNLNLMHLFTPSGIHLSSLFFLLFPILSLFSKQSPKIKLLFSLTILFLPWSMGDYLSIKRITLLKLCSLGIKQIFKWELKGHQLFLIIFFLDYIFGTYSQSPLSFIYSFLFLGIIFSKESTSTPLPYLFWGGQILISYYFKNSLTVLGPFLGFLLTGLFSFLFPILLSYHLLYRWIDFNYVEFILKLFLKLSNYSNQLSLQSGVYYASLPLLIAAFFSSSSQKKKFIPWLILIHANPIL